MLKGQSIIYFGPEKWNGMWRNRHHLMTRFSKENKVLYVEPVLGTRWKIEQLLKGKTSKKEILKSVYGSRLKKIDDNLHIYKNPAYIPIIGRYPINKIAWLAWEKLLKEKLKTLGFNNPIIWLSKPNMNNYLGCFNEKLSIYHVVDEYSAYTQTGIESNKEIKNKEEIMIKSVDMVIVVSKNLYNSKHLYNKHTYIVPNAVDYRSYLKASKSAAPLPKDIAPLHRPIIGYSGLISKRLNLKMIKEIAETNPEWSIALIGTVDDTGCVNQLVDLKKTKNVNFLGEKNIDELPFYVSAFDVCIIPYEINDETKNLNPLKLYDFMATGKPIVTTNIPAAQKYRKFIYIVNSSKNISKFINKALNEKNNRKKEERIKVASMNTWDHRVETLSKLIEMKIDVKNPTNVIKNDSIRYR